MKRIYLFLMSVCTVLTFSVNSTLALSNIEKDNMTIIEHTAEQIAQDEAEVIAQMQCFDRLSRMDETVTKWVKVETKTVKKKGIGYAANQKVNGTVFTSKGGFYWQDGGNNVKVSLSLTFKSKAASVNLSISPGKKANSGSWVTSNYINQACKLYIYKDLQVTQYKVYTKNKYQPDSAYKFSGYKYSTIETREYLDVKRV